MVVPMSQPRITIMNRETTWRPPVSGHHGFGQTHFPTKQRNATDGKISCQHLAALALAATGAQTHSDHLRTNGIKKPNATFDVHMLEILLSSQMPRYLHADQCNDDQ